MTEPHKITIKPLQLFMLSYNDLILGEFQVESSWEGMIKLVSIAKKEVIIIECRDSFVENLFNFEGKFDEKKAEDFTIISASPSILDKMNPLACEIDK